MNVLARPVPLLACIAVLLPAAGCGFIDDTLDYPVEGSFGGSFQLDLTALNAEPIAPGCQEGVCAPMRDCHVRVEQEAGMCAVWLERTLRVGVDLESALPDLVRLEAQPVVDRVGPLHFTYASNTLAGAAGGTPVTVWLAPASDVDERLRLKLAELPPPPDVTPGVGVIELDPEVAAAVQAMIAGGEKQFSLVATTELGPVGEGETPPPGSIGLNVDVELALRGRLLAP